MNAVPSRNRVLIVDDHAVVRAGLRYVFETFSTIEVCGEVATAGEAVEAVRAQRPDIVLLDLALGDASGRTLIPPLKQLPNPPRILVMSMHDECVWGRLVIAAGADGFVAKSSPPETVIEAVTAVLGGARWVEGRALPRESAGGSRTPTSADLSSRERQILAGIAEGLSAKDIAAQLGVMPATIDSHKRNIRTKLGIDSMAELIVWAQSLRSGDAAS